MPMWCVAVLRALRLGTYSKRAARMQASQNVQAACAATRLPRAGVHNIPAPAVGSRLHSEQAGTL